MPLILNSVQLPVSKAKHGNMLLLSDTWNVCLGLTMTTPPVTPYFWYLWNVFKASLSLYLSVTSGIMTPCLQLSLQWQILNRWLQKHQLNPNVYTHIFSFKSSSSIKVTSISVPQNLNNTAVQYIQYYWLKFVYLYPISN